MQKKQRKRADCSFKKVGASYPEEIKKKIVSEVQSGFHSRRTAAKRYGISRNTVNAWVIQHTLFTLNPENPQADGMKKSTESSTIRSLSKQVAELKKALAKAQLKIEGLSLQFMSSINFELLTLKHCLSTKYIKILIYKERLNIYPFPFFQAFNGCKTGFG